MRDAGLVFLKELSVISSWHEAFPSIMFVLVHFLPYVCNKEILRLSLLDFSFQGLKTLIDQIYPV